MDFVKISPSKTTHEPSFPSDKKKINKARGLEYKYKEIRVEKRKEILVA